MSNSNRIAVIGAGVVGGSVAFHLSEFGADVTVFDKNSAGSGASSHSFAWLNAFGKSPRHYFDLNHRSMELWTRFVEKLGKDVGLRWGGVVTYCAGSEGSQELLAQCRKVQEWGYAARLISREEFARLEPDMEIGPFELGVHTMSEGHVLPTKVAEACMDKVVEHGGEVHLNSSVDDISLEGDEVNLEVNGKNFVFDKVVIAAGTDSTQLADMASIKLPQRISPGVVARTAPIPPIIKNLSSLYLPPSDEWGNGIHIRQDHDGVVMFGAGDQENESDDDSQEYADSLIERAIRYFPALSDVEAIRVPVGYRPMPIDGLPVLGFAPEATNIYITLMHSGATLAPIVGNLSALEIMTGTKTDCLEPYRPSRFK
ncbi:MAG: hypothetical protein CL781_03090 [Chloroflexi bacterium]|nr:hypothetical protein [Chloroflexota bacterium]